MSLRVLAVDPSCHNCGWALLDDGQLTGSGCRRFAHEVGGNFFAALDQMSRWLAVLHQERPIGRMLLEEPVLRGRVHGPTVGAWYHLGLCCWRLGIERIDINPSHLKRWATGLGRAKDAEMIAAAKRLGFAPRTPHEADALCMLAMVGIVPTKSGADNAVPAPQQGNSPVREAVPGERQPL